MESRAFSSTGTQFTFTADFWSFVWPRISSPHVRRQQRLCKLKCGGVPTRSASAIVMWPRPVKRLRADQPAPAATGQPKRAASRSSGSRSPSVSSATPGRHRQPSGPAGTSNDFARRSGRYELQFATCERQRKARQRGTSRIWRSATGSPGSSVEPAACPLCCR
jgi:hypothetical protein